MGIKVFADAVGGAIKGGFNTVKTNLGLNKIQGLSNEVLERQAKNLASASANLQTLDKDVAITMAQAKNLTTAENITGEKAKELLQAQLDKEALATSKAIYNGTGMKGYYDDMGMKYSGVRSALAQAGQYYWTGATKAERATRIGATYMAGAIGTRAIGSVFVNSNGERDIAGLPGI